MSFAHRLIEVDFSLANGVFDATGGNNYNTVGLRVIAHIDVVEGNQGATAQLAIYGLPLSVMNALSTLGAAVNAIGQNRVSVFAGDDASGLSLVFSGIIKYAWVDAQAMPEVCFRVEATTTGHANLKPIAVTTKPGPTDAVGILAELAGQAGFSFEGHAQPVMLSRPYLPGSVGSQIRKCAEHANLCWVAERDILSVYPMTGNRGGDTLISPQTGAIGYPMFKQSQVIVTCLLKPEISVGNTVTIQSDITPACGTWTVKRMTLELEAPLPRGKWNQILMCVDHKNNQGIAPP